jgi:hypothetical protein
MTPFEIELLFEEYDEPLGYGYEIEVTDDARVLIRAYDEMYDPDTEDEWTIHPPAFEGRWDDERGVIDLRSIDKSYGADDPLEMAAAATKFIRRYAPKSG